MGRYFGTDGFRGEANVTLTVESAFKVGRFLGWYYGRKKRLSGIGTNAKIVIGKDTRRSGYMFEYSLVSGITASGADAYLLHVTTTPSVSYITKVDGFDCGIMISASHNPYTDNGIKLFSSSGEKMGEEVTALTESYLDGTFGEIPYATGAGIGCTVDYASGRNRYIGYLLSLGIYSFKGIKVGLDCANGSAWSIARSVFEALGAETYVINDKPNGFNINKDAGSTHMDGLCALVKEKGLDVGFAYDGDADRCLCSDECGNVVNGDKILYISAACMKKRGALDPPEIVATIMSNMGLDKALEKIGVGCVRTAVGDRYVHEYMAEHGNRLGGEQSGHIIFSKYATTGDGILTSLKVMEAMISSGLPLSRLAAPVKDYPQVLINVKVSDAEACKNDENVCRAVAEAQKKLGESGRILVRPSGTEPLVRVMAEAEDTKLCTSVAEEVAEAVRSACRKN